MCQRAHIFALPAVLAAATATAQPEGDLTIFDDFVVPSGETVSAVFKAISQTDGERDLFQTANGNPASVQIDNSGADQLLGRGLSDEFDVLVSWSEFFENGSGNNEASRLRFEVTTSNGASLIPASDFDDGFQFVRWEIGDHSDAADDAFADPISFRERVTEITLVEATVVFFNDQTVLNTISYGFTIGAGGDWDGTDSEVGNIFNLDRNANRIQITYDYTPIPAPASAVGLAGLGLIASRRRR